MVAAQDLAEDAGLRDAGDQALRDDEIVVTGALAPGEKLPSVRSMAASLAINPNTIQRAYTELESDGFILSIPGKGSFAGRRQDEADQDALRLEAL